MSESQQTLAANTEKTAISDSLTKKVSELDHVKKVEKGFTIVPTEAIASVGTTKTPFTQLQTWTDVNTDNSLLVGKKPGNNEIVVPSMDLTYKMTSSDGKLVVLTQTVKVSGVVKGNPGTVSLNMNFKTTQDLFKANGLVSQPNFIVPTVDDSHNVDAVVKKIQALKTDGKKDFVTFSLGAVLKPINDITSIVTIVLAMIAGISLLVSLMMIIATTYMSVAERTKEIGILRALGARKGDIRWLFVIETIILGLASAVLGIIVALIGQTVVNSAVSNLLDKFHIIQVSAGAIIGSVIIAIVIALFASLMPAGKAANLNPIEALSND